jgi:NTE family protein
LPAAPAAAHDRRVNGLALVLGGGGSAGHAWMVGVLAGLVDAGLGVTDADLIIGTSAGSTAAAQIGTGTSPADLLAGILAERTPQRPRSGGADHASTEALDVMQLTADLMADATGPADMRRRLGAAALERAPEPGGAAEAERRAVVASRIPDPRWPARPVQIVVVDARTGDPVLLDRESGGDLVDAVTASTAIGFGAGPPHTIGDRRYIDGGYRSPENADLAAGYGRVLVLSPFGGRTRAPLDWGMHLAAQTETLRAGGSVVEAVVPDDASRAAFGATMMELGTRPPAARAGFDQGRALAERLAGSWT